MREGEADDLPGVRRIGEDLLIAGHGGIEADLADRVAYGAQALAFQHGSVGQHQKRRRLGFIPSAGGGGFRQGHGHLVAYYKRRGKRWRTKVPGRLGGLMTRNQFERLVLTIMAICRGIPKSRWYTIGITQ